MTWGVKDRDAHFLAGVQQQIYSTHEVVDDAKRDGSVVTWNVKAPPFSGSCGCLGSDTAGVQQVYSTRGCHREC